VTATQENENRTQQLEQLIHNTIPLGKIMGLQVTHLTDNVINLEAPVADNNINIHGTAFAGSIYSMCALTAWGFMHMRLLKENITADVVIARGEIRYISPIKENIYCECEVEEKHYNEFHQRMLKEGKASIPVVVHALENDHLRAVLEARVSVIITES
jgi:thioesterase domain-containing protein